MKEKYHFIGLGGIGMSALARILLQQGMEVQGSDAQNTPLLAELQKEGALVSIGHHEKTLGRPRTVVYSTDIKEHNVELAFAKQKGYLLLHRSELLDQLMRGKKPLLVTGSHGKTTTTALLSAIFLEARLDPSFVIGGILLDTHTNGRYGKGEYFIAEADESDGSFLKTPSFGAIVTSLGNDHLDHWKTQASLDTAFAQFCSQVRHPEHLFWCLDDDRLVDLKLPGVSYGFSIGSQFHCRRFRPTEKGCLVDFSFEGTLYPDVAISLYGQHNALNAAAVFAMALSFHIPETVIRKALQNFAGIKRRLEYKGEKHKLQLFDDYAHHPAKIAATLRALRDKIREKKLVAIFQPHRFSRVERLADEFPPSFEKADLVLMTDIYSAREAPIPGVSTENLFQKMKAVLKDKLHYIPRSELESKASDYLRPFDVAILLGAGDITYAASGILDHFAKKAPKLKVAVLSGGTSIEHEISLRSGSSIASHLDSSVYDVESFVLSKKGHWGGDSQSVLTPDILQKLLSCDVCIPAFHGPQGEDGMIQGFLDTLQIPYVGCDYQTAALCMNKSWAKQIAILHHIPTAPFIEYSSIEFKKDPKGLIKRISERGIHYPVYIKPVHLGSSLAISRATTPEEILAGAKQAFEFDDVLIVEPEIRGKEIEVSVLGNDLIRIAPPAMVMHTGFLSYELKYGNQPHEKRVPAPIEPIQTELVQDLASRLYAALHCKGLTRLDFFLDEQGHFWFNEANPFPGFTTASGFAKMWGAAGIGFSQLCDELIVLALHRSRR